MYGTNYLTGDFAFPAGVRLKPDLRNCGVCVPVKANPEPVGIISLLGCWEWVNRYFVKVKYALSTDRLSQDKISSLKFAFQ